jgi:peptidase E
MKTTIIMHGGFEPGNQEKDSSRFYTEILKHAPDNARVLVVPFAKEPERIPAATEKIIRQLNSNKWQDKITIEVAEKQSFAEQITRSDVIYLQGGATLKLLAALQEFPKFKEWCQGKTLAGESAGANVMGQYFYSKKSDSIGKGLGILPVKTIPHYKEESTEKLDKVGKEFELLLLPEYTYRVFEI